MEYLGIPRYQEFSKILRDMQIEGVNLLSPCSKEVLKGSLYAPFLIPSSDQISGESRTENKKISSSGWWRIADKLVLPCSKGKKNFHSFFQVENFPGHWLPPARKWTESGQLSSVFPTSLLGRKLSNSIWPFDSWRVYTYSPSSSFEKRKFSNFSTNNKKSNRNRETKLENFPRTQNSKDSNRKKEDRRGSSLEIETSSIRLSIFPKPSDRLIPCE